MDLPKREELESNSRRFEVKYLLAVMNSTVARNFLRARRRSNIHLYPDDWKVLPIPAASAAEQAEISELVERILLAKRAGDEVAVKELEAAIDTHVFRLYTPTPEEIKIVKDAAKS